MKNSKNIFINQEKYRKYVYLFIFYSISHVWILFLNKSLFWDDWAILSFSKETSIEHFNMIGAPWLGYLHRSLQVFDISIYKYLTFFILFANGILLDKILERTNFINSNNRFIVCLLYLTTPLYIARVTIICFPYTLSIFLFFLAWYLMPNKKIISIILFFLSFSTNSLLVFYSLPVLEKISNNFKIKLKFSLEFIKDNLFFLIIPFIFYFAKIKFFSPYGTHSEYNQSFSLKKLFIASIKQIFDFTELNNSFILVIPILVFGFTYIFYRFINIKYSASDSKYYKQIFIVGLFSLALGLFPYWILGHAAVFTDWSSRHQLLMPFGTALITSSILSKFYLPERRILLSLFISIFLIINLTNYFSIIQDSDKQQEIINQLSINESIEKKDIIIFKDKTKNALNRKYRFYEWQGLLNKAYPNSKIIGIGSEDLKYSLENLKRSFKLNYQKFYGIRNQELPENIKVSEVIISYNKNILNNKFLKKILIKLNIFKSQPISIKETNSKIIKNSDLFNNDLSNFSIYENN